MPYQSTTYWCGVWCVVCNDFYVLSCGVGVGGVTTASGAVSVSYKYVPRTPWLQWSVEAGSDNRPGWWRCWCWNVLTLLILQNVPSIESDSLLPAGGGPGAEPGGQWQWQWPACRRRGDPAVPLHRHLLLWGPGLRLLRRCGQWLPGRAGEDKSTVGTEIFCF